MVEMVMCPMCAFVFTCHASVEDCGQLREENRGETPTHSHSSCSIGSSSGSGSVSAIRRTPASVGSAGSNARHISLREIQTGGG